MEITQQIKKDLDLLKYIDLLDANGIPYIFKYILKESSMHNQTKALYARYLKMFFDSKNVKVPYSNKILASTETFYKYKKTLEKYKFITYNKPEKIIVINTKMYEYENGTLIEPLLKLTTELTLRMLTPTITGLSATI